MQFGEVGFKTKTERRYSPLPVVTKGLLSKRSQPLRNKFTNIYKNTYFITKETINQHFDKFSPLQSL